MASGASFALGARVQRFNMLNMDPSTWTDLVWFLRRRKRRQVEVFQFDGFGVSYPPVLRERFDMSWTPTAEQTSLRNAREGMLGWNRGNLLLSDCRGLIA
jgi:hypothetical protein